MIQKIKCIWCKGFHQESFRWFWMNYRWKKMRTKKWSALKEKGPDLCGGISGYRWWNENENQARPLSKRVCHRWYTTILRWGINGWVRRETWDEEKSRRSKETFLTWYHKENAICLGGRPTIRMQSGSQRSCFNKHEWKQWLAISIVFMEQFPICHSGGSRRTKLLKVWEGLGYYSRARNPRLPPSKSLPNSTEKCPNQLKRSLIKGIGPYTAGAIGSSFWLARTGNRWKCDAGRQSVILYRSRYCESQQPKTIWRGDENDHSPMNLVSLIKPWWILAHESGHPITMWKVSHQSVLSCLWENRQTDFPVKSKKQSQKMSITSQAPSKIKARLLVQRPETGLLALCGIFLWWWRKNSTRLCSEHGQKESSCSGFDCRRWCPRDFSWSACRLAKRHFGRSLISLVIWNGTSFLFLHRKRESSRYKTANGQQKNPFKTMFSQNLSRNWWINEEISETR